MNFWQFFFPLKMLKFEFKLLVCQQIDLSSRQVDEKCSEPCLSQSWAIEITKYFLSENNVMTNKVIKSGTRLDIHVFCNGQFFPYKQS